MITLTESLQEFGAALLLGSAGLGLAWLRRFAKRS